MNAARFKFEHTRARSFGGRVLFCALLAPCVQVAALLPPIQEIEEPPVLRTEALYRKEAEEHPDDSQKLYRYGKFLNSERRDVAAARRYYERAIDKWPKNIEQFSTQLLYDYAELLGREYQDYVGAVRVLRRVISFFPDAPEPKMACAKILSDKLKEYDEAEAMFKHAANLEKSYVEAHIAYADFLSEKRKDCAAAEKIYVEALNMSANWPSAKDVAIPILEHYAASLATCRKDFDAADKVYKKLFAEDPTVPYSAVEGFADLYAAFSKDDAPVEEQYRKFAPDNLDFTLFYTNFLMSRSRKEEGLAVLERAFTLAPKVGTDWYSRRELVQCWFAALAFRPEPARQEALVQIKKLLAAGLRYPFYSLPRVVALAKRDGHPDAVWLGKLADVLDQKEEANSLDGWAAWAAIQIDK